MSRRHLRIVGIAILLGTVFTSGALAQTASESLPDLWSQSVTLATEGNLAAASDALQHLLESSASRGIRRLPSFAEAAASLAQSGREKGNAALSGWALDAARRLDPFSPDVRFAAVDLAASQHNWGSIPTPLARGILNTVRDYSSSVISGADFILSLIIALALAAAALAIALIVGHGRPAAHDLRELFAKRTRAGTATVLAFAVLFLPIFLWVSPLALIPFWLMLFFAYGSGGQRVLIVISLVVLAITPVVADWTAYRIAGTENAIVEAAEADLSGSYRPSTIQRMRDITSVVPDDARVQLLLGNLLLQEGNTRDAMIHYQRSAEIDPSRAGTQLNIGDIHFLNEDYPAASAEYDQAAKLDPRMAIAYYNQSVAAGEQYEFDRQGQQLEQAKKVDRSAIERILADPPSRKIVVYRMPLSEAWALASTLAKNNDVRELFGQYAHFDLVGSALNPVTLGCLIALVLAFALWGRMKKNGVANACVKCGRTFCYRCKASRESATYCTQCIHIYLKRDGVALEAKTRKMNEVQGYQRSSLRARKILTTFLPGTANILDGSVFRGSLILTLFLLFIVIAVLVGGLAPIATPAAVMRTILRVVSIALAVIVWLIGTIPVYRQQVAG